jgi:hypothetical protein
VFERRLRRFLDDAAAAAHEPSATRPPCPAIDRARAAADRWLRGSDTAGARVVNRISLAELDWDDAAPTSESCTALAQALREMISEAP